MKTHTTIENELKASRAILQRLHLEGMPSTGAIHHKDLFADSLLETPGEQRARRASATVFSLLFQCSSRGGAEIGAQACHINSTRVCHKA